MCNIFAKFGKKMIKRDEHAAIFLVNLNIFPLKNLILGHKNYSISTLQPDTFNFLFLHSSFLIFNTFFLFLTDL